MKVIDLLNKIANGEESDTITEFEFDKRIWNFFKLQDSEYCVDEWLLNQEIVITNHKEVIEEDKKIEKLETYKEIDDEEHYANILKVSKNGEYEINEALSVVVDKINEIIDKINKGEIENE